MDAISSHKVECLARTGTFRKTANPRESTPIEPASRWVCSPTLLAAKWPAGSILSPSSIQDLVHLVDLLYLPVVWCKF